MSVVAANYPDDIQEIGDRIAALTPAEAKELNEYLKEKYNITPPPEPEIQIPDKEIVEEPECDAYEVVLKSFGEKKIAVIKVIRQILGLGLKEAKTFVEEVPKVVRSELTEQEANDIKQKLEDAGGTVTF
jgi:large subunit ribosomal protein L7/L12